MLVEVLEKIKILPAYYQNEIADFISFIFYKYENDTINKETHDAILEMQELKKDKNKKIYASFSELLGEVQSDV